MGLITNIQRFSVDDGPGIRTTVFLKGCTLECRWCHNPETFRFGKQLQYQERNCQNCGKCVSRCPRSAQKLIDAIHSMGWEKCNTCLTCIDSCAYGALSIIGEEIDAETVCEKILRDKTFYEKSNGGITLSGGEPLVQGDFVAHIFRILKEIGVHTALDTAGNIEWSSFEKVLPWTDLILFDLKIIDEKKHKEMTGSSNQLIIENFGLLNEQNIDIWVRTPIMSGVNDGDDETDSRITILKKAKNVKQVTLLPYHKYGLEKYHTIGLDDTPHRFQPPSSDKMKNIINRLKAAGIQNVEVE